MLELLLIERDVIVSYDVPEMSHEVAFRFLFTLLLLDQNRSLKAVIVFLLKQVEQRRMLVSVNAYLLKFVAEVVLDRLLN